MTKGKSIAAYILVLAGKRINYMPEYFAVELPKSATLTPHQTHKYPAGQKLRKHNHPENQVLWMDRS